MRGADRGGERAGVERQRKVTDLPIDPVTNELDPTVARLCLSSDSRRDVRRLDLDADVAQIPADGRDVLARAGQPGYARVVVEFGIGIRRSGVPDGKYAGVPIYRGEFTCFVQTADGT